MLTVCSWSHQCRRCNRVGSNVKVSAEAIMASMNPVISSAVSPFAVSAVRKLAIKHAVDLAVENFLECVARLFSSRSVPRTRGLRTSREI